MTTLCFATNNLNKLEEVHSSLNGLYAIRSLQDIGCFSTLPEEGYTLEENSFQKAEYVANRYGVDCFSDDTGLEVEVLHNAPGVHSARYAGKHRSCDDNMNLLLQKLAGHTNRTARFRTVITLLQKGQVHVFEGVAEGTIAHERRGTNGFGYDPIFVPQAHSLSMAEMTLEEKNTISHRKKAVDKLVNHLRDHPL